MRSPDTFWIYLDRLVAENGIELELFSARHYYAERETWSTEAHRTFFQVEPILMDFDNLPPGLPIIKGGIVATNEREMALAQMICGHFTGRLLPSEARTPAYPGVVFFNLISLQASKGRALLTLCEHFGIAAAEFR